MDTITRLVEKFLSANSLSDWATGLMTGVLTFVALAATRHLTVKRLGKVVEASPVVWDDIVLELVRTSRKFFFAAVAAYVATQAIAMPAVAHTWVTRLVLLSVIAQVGIWGSTTITFWVERCLKTTPATDGARITTVRALGLLSRLFFFSVLLLWGLDNLGVDITTLVAGLGVGGIAVALAVQKILGDLFASLTIVLDKPFVLGDFISVGEHAGTIENIGLKTTRLRSLSGEQLVFPNADLLQSRIRNFKRMSERRAIFQFGVAYETPLEKLRAIPRWTQEVVESQRPRVRFERAHFKSFGQSSLDFEVVYWVLDPDYLVYMDVQQAINLSLCELLVRERIDFAYPTQTVYVRPSPSVVAASPAPSV